MADAIAKLFVLWLIIAIRLGILAAGFYLFHINSHTDLFTACTLVIVLCTDVD